VLRYLCPMPLDQPEEELKGSEMSFLEHLEALRWHLIRSASAVVVFGALAFVFSDIVFDGVLLAPKNSTFPTYRFFCWLSHQLFHDDSICLGNLNFELISTQMSGQFTTHLMVAFATGLILAFPYLLWEIWRFVKPALYPGERKHANGMVFWGSFLFALGISFGYFVITPLSVYFFGNYQVSGLVANQIAVGSFISTVVSTTFGTGIVFELPIIIYFLAKIGLVTPAFLKNARKISYIVILIVAAIITPPDVTSQIIVSIPLFLLYEVGIWIAARVERKKAQSN
jgi:sec-independent protein translocase protein TatC